MITEYFKSLFFSDCYILNIFLTAFKQKILNSNTYEKQKNSEPLKKTRSSEFQKILALTRLTAQKSRNF